MEFINYTRKDVNTPGMATQDIKNVKSILGLKLFLNSNIKDDTFSGIGSYLIVDVKDKGTSKMVKIPFFGAYNRDKFVNPNGFTYVNPLAEKIIVKVLKRNKPNFDLLQFKADAATELNIRIASLGTSPEDLQLKADLEDRRDNIIALAEKSDTENLVREEINYLKAIVEKGLDLGKCSNNNLRIAAINKFCNYVERLETLKVQLKNLTWSQKKGLRKLNNKTFKRVAAIGTAVLVAGSVIFYSIFKKPNKANNPKPKTTVTMTNTPSAVVKTTPTASSVVTAKPTITPRVTSQPTVSTDSKKLSNAIDSNYNKFKGVKKAIEAYGLNYRNLVEGYTMVENVEYLNGKDGIEIANHIASTRTLISALLYAGLYDQLPLRQETLEVMQKCFNGNKQAGISFVKSSFKSGEPLVDMLTIGELESNLMGDQELLNFNKDIYYVAIEEYRNAIINGNLKISLVEPSMIKTLGVYPRA